MGDRSVAFKGTSGDQDPRFLDKQKKLKKSLRFPKCFDTKVDLRKVDMKVIKPWVAMRVAELLGMEDDVVTAYATELLDQENPDPRDWQIHLTGFLERHTFAFMEELWSLLIEAQDSPGGIPPRFLEDKKQELLQARVREQQLSQAIQAARMRAEEEDRGHEAGPPGMLPKLTHASNRMPSQMEMSQHELFQQAQHQVHHSAVPLPMGVQDTEIMAKQELLARLASEKAVLEAETVHMPENKTLRTGVGSGFSRRLISAEEMKALTESTAAAPSNGHRGDDHRHRDRHRDRSPEDRRRRRSVSRDRSAGRHRDRERERDRDRDREQRTRRRRRERSRSRSGSQERLRREERRARRREERRRRDRKRSASPNGDGADHKRSRRSSSQDLEEREQELRRNVLEKMNDAASASSST